MTSTPKAKRPTGPVAKTYRIGREKLRLLLEAAEREHCPNEPSCLRPDEHGVTLHVRDRCGVCCGSKGRTHDAS
jgi:hypothetical protein